MNRIDVHNHFIPALDDGCRDIQESLLCLRTMANTGYSKIFCTPHCGSAEFTDLTNTEVAERVRSLQGHVDAANIPLQLRPGGELRLSPSIPTDLPQIPTFGHDNKYVLADIWEPDWPKWATKAIQYLQSKNLTVILAHPERMPLLRHSPDKIDELAQLGLLFQGNLGPIGGNDSPDIVALAQRYLQDGRYFMVGTDGHRINHLPTRLTGLATIEKLVGKEKLTELTETHPARLWT